jgi:hypothetical protein
MLTRRTTVVYDPPTRSADGREVQATIGMVHAWLGELLEAGIDPETPYYTPGSVVVSVTEEQ